ncbi:MAG: helix-turn-helix transcriptional regulator [Pseudomonadota bacterium]
MDGYDSRPSRGQQGRKILENQPAQADLSGEILLLVQEMANQILPAITEPVDILDRNFRILWANAASAKMNSVAQEEMIGCFCYEIWGRRNMACENCLAMEAMSTGKPSIRQRCVNGPDGESKWLEIYAWPILNRGGEIVTILKYARDITFSRQMEETLHQRSYELEMKDRRLQEVDTTLKVMLKKRDEDRKQLEETIVTNVRALIVPYMEALKSTPLDEQQSSYLSVLESNVKQITSPFVDRLSSRFANLTPMEVQIANLLKEGRPTKQIAEILHLSINTIIFHRQNLRKKLKLTNRKRNLVSYLKALSLDH